jgi:hypothetical protein
MNQATRSGSNLRNNIFLRTLVCILCLRSVGPVFPALAQNTFDPVTIAHRADQWMEPYVAMGDFSGVVLIASRDQTWSRKPRRGFPRLWSSTRWG